GNGTYSSLDTSFVSRMAVGLDTGFTAFQLADPRLIGDLTLNGGFSSLDTSRISRVVVGLPVDEVPAQPSPLPSVVPTGPDPKLSIPRTLTASPGEALTVPIEVDSIVDLTGNELYSADIVILFDPAVLQANSVSLGDVPVGSPEADWTGPTTNVDNTTGQLIVGLSNLNGLGGVFNGSLLNISFTIQADAPQGLTAINLAASSTTPHDVTYLNEGGLMLIPAPTNANNDPIDGQIVISSVVPARHPYDVNADGGVTAKDALILLSELNARVAAGPSQLAKPDDSPPLYLDLTGDDLLTPLDLLLVINYLNTKISTVGEGEPAPILLHSATVDSSRWIAPIGSAGLPDRTRARHHRSAEPHHHRSAANEFARVSHYDHSANPSAGYGVRNPHGDSSEFPWDESVLDQLDIAPAAEDRLLDALEADVAIHWRA
ncbi:MAG: cohesin domain-containing protein, partial [Planctomycetes bacterium]|nr:cohesin domain-containing protein [Planctomycetota bacterium]